MQSTRGLSGTLPPRKLKSEKPTRKSVATAETSSRYAIEEIAAYIVIRDGLLTEAEKTTTCESLRRVSIANDFVKHCLEPARAPYEAQNFPQLDALRELERCEKAKLRIAELSAK